MATLTRRKENPERTQGARSHIMMKLLDKILQQAQPNLAGQTIRDGVVGLHFVGVQLDTGNCHFVTLMREALDNLDQAYGLEMLGKPATEIAQWVQTGENDLQRALGMAALNAASPYYPRPRSGKYPLPQVDNQQDDGVPLVRPGDTVGMIGLMTPSVRQLQPLVKKIIVFDRALEQQIQDEGFAASFGENVRLYPMRLQAELLPACDVVLITGTTMINHTLEQILSFCPHAREILLKGFSLAYYPQAYQHTAITAISSVYFEPDSAALFRPLSLGGGWNEVMRYAHHCCTRLR